MLRLAWRDLAAERLPAICSAVSVSAIFAPLLVLAGLQAGIMRGLRQTLLEDPHAREITTVANRSFSAPQLQAIAAWPDIAFLVPKTRTLAASALIETAGHDEARLVELIPTAPGDPLLGAMAPNDAQIVLSSPAAAFLKVGPGAQIRARIARLVDGRQDLVLVPLTVSAVADAAVTARDAGFVTVGFALSVEDFQEGDAPWRGVPPGSASSRQRSYAGFRLYARRLDQVPRLDAALRGRDIDIVSRAGDVAGLLALDRHLTILFFLVASLGAGGFLISLGTGLWANVERKRTSLALLRFAGFGRASLLVFPLVQALVLALGGSALGVLAALGVERIINIVFAGTLSRGRPLCNISPLLAIMATLATLGGATVASLFAARRAARIQAWEGVTSA